MSVPCLRIGHGLEPPREGAWKSVSPLEGDEIQQHRGVGVPGCVCEAGTCDELWPLLCSSWKCRRSNWFHIGTCMINTEILFFFQNSNDDDDDCLTCICIINLRHQTGPEAWNRGISCLIPLIIGSNPWYTRAVSIFWSFQNFAFSPQAKRRRGNWEEGTMTMGNFRAISQSSAP